MPLPVGGGKAVNPGGSMPLPVGGGLPHAGGSFSLAAAGAPALGRSVRMPVGGGSKPATGLSIQVTGVASPVAGRGSPMPAVQAPSPMAYAGGSAHTSIGAEAAQAQHRVLSQRPTAGGSAQLPASVPSTPQPAKAQSISAPSRPLVQVDAVEGRRSASLEPSGGKAAERERTQSPQVRQLQPPWMAQLQEVRKTLDDHQQPTFNVVQRGAVLQDSTAGDERRSAQKLEQRFEHLQQVQRVQQADLVALERKVQEVNAREASQQAEQRLFLRTLRDEIITLAAQVQSLRDNPQQNSRSEMEAIESEFDQPPLEQREELRANIDSEFLQLRLDFDNRITQQETQLKCWQGEVLQRLAKCVEDQFAQHSKLITAVLSEIKGLKLLQGEKDSQTDNGMEARLAEIGDSLQVCGQDSLTSSWQKIQVEMEEAAVKEAEDGMEAIKKSNALLMKTQADLSSLRDLLHKSTSEQDQTSQERYLGMIRCLEAEEADLKEVHSLLRQQQALQDQLSPRQQDIALALAKEEATAAEQQAKEQVLKAPMSPAAVQAAREAALLAMQRSSQVLQQNRLNDSGQVVQHTATRLDLHTGNANANFNGGYPAELSPGLSPQQSWKMAGT